MRTLSEWNKYLDDLKRLRDLIYEGKKTTDGLCVKLETEECDIIWRVLNSEVTKIVSIPLEFYKKSEG